MGFSTPKCLRNALDAQIRTGPLLDSAVRWLQPNMKHRAVLLMIVLGIQSSPLWTQSPAAPRLGPKNTGFPQFTDFAHRAGVQFRTETSATLQKYLLETMGGGVAIFDYDGDGLMDLFFVNGAQLGDPMSKGEEPDKSHPRYWNRLYHNNGDGTFTDVTEKAGLQGCCYGMGVAVGDYDNDGHPDLYVTGWKSNTLYHNNGNGTFSDVTKKAGVAAAVASVVDKFGRVDVCINCAGIGTPMKILDKEGQASASCGKFAKVVAVNLLGSFNVMAHCVAAMSRNAPENDERGAVINVASGAAFEGQVGQSAYSASKAGVVGLSAARFLAGEGLKVLVIEGQRAVGGETILADLKNGEAPRVGTKH